MGLFDSVLGAVRGQLQSQIAGGNLTQVLGKLAGQVGLDGSQLSDQLAQMLPGLVDKLTPHGTAPEGGLGNTGDVMGMLGGLLGRAAEANALLQ